jgi:phytol kinase
VLLVISALCAALVSTAIAGRSLDPEIARKGLHVSMGVVTLALPWLFVEFWPVLITAVFAAGILLALRTVPALRCHGGALHAVRRDSLGEFHFALGACAVFLLAQGNKLLFVVPMLVLTFADTAAALVGTRFGIHSYAIGHARKTLEGSGAFLVVAFLCTYIPLALVTDATAPECAGIALMVAATATACEAIAGRGLDNLLVPLGAYATLALLHDESAATAAASLLPIKTP